jgi:hypothetical protein
MTALHIATVNILLRARVPMRALMQLLPARPDSLGETLASQVHKAVLQAGLGYYPPLEYIRSRNMVAPYLLDAVEQIAATSEQYLREQLGERLAPVFSNVSVRSLQFPAFALPPIRMSEPSALARLAEHYVPSTMRCELTVSLVRKQAAESGLDKFVVATFKRSLADAFENLDVSAPNGN